MEVLNQTNSDWGAEPERGVLLLTYILHGLAPFTFFLTTIAAVIISLIKIKETHSEAIRSHHRWLLRTFWWTLLWSAVSYVLMLVLIGFVGYIVLGIWWLYRVIFGAINFYERKPMPA